MTMNDTSSESLAPDSKDSNPEPIPIMPAAVPNDPLKQAAVIKNMKTTVVKLARESEKRKLTPCAEPDKTAICQIDGLLIWLDESVDITPSFKQSSQIEEILKVIFQNSRFHFPVKVKDKAERLFAKWTSQNWGAPSLDKSHPNNSRHAETDHQLRLAKRVKTSSARKDSDAAEVDIKPVKPDHPIYGIDGIMHGVCLKRCSRRVFVLNPEYEKRDCKVFGHNGLAVGKWFPKQFSALFYGAHGSSQAGIHGDPSSGAYSIVVSAVYDDLDADDGETLRYSGSGSHDNQDRHAPAPATTGTQALHTSLETRRPARVLRSSTGKSRWAPSCGLRYDGLYLVVAKQNRRNAKGGLYEQFKLVREPGQGSLDACKRRPTPREQGDFARINNGY